MFCTFIIPTIGRPALNRAIKSLFVQTDKHWTAIVVWDGAKKDAMPVLLHDYRITHLGTSGKKLGHGNVGALVRNVGLAIAQSEWIANLDDDDTVTPDYVERLKQESDGCDLIHFRTRYPDLQSDTRPGRSQTEFRADTVCNSFAFRLAFARAHNIQYIDDPSEDWATFKALLDAGATAKMSKHVTYNFGF